MRIGSISVLAVATVVALAGCSGQRPAYSIERINRVLATAPGVAQPSKVVATEIAFARAAREDGQWTAFRSFAAPGAIIHGPDGPVAADRWLAAQNDPAQSNRRSPRAVWMSCDSMTAVSFGRFVDPEGLVGHFTTVWQRQPDASYRWVYAASALDDPQPPRRPAADPDDDAIVVTGIDSVQGHVAHCPTDAAAQSGPLEVVAETTRSDGGKSPDGSLRWRWEHRADGARRMIVHLLTDDGWTTPLDHRFDLSDGA